jgi:hypothetical protein
MNTEQQTTQNYTTQKTMCVEQMGLPLQLLSVTDLNPLDVSVILVFCTVPNILKVVKSRRIRWAGHEARTGRREVCTGCWLGNLR